MDNCNSSAGPAATVFDPASGRVYITENYGDEPAVHVYQIDTPHSIVSSSCP